MKGRLNPVGLNEMFGGAYDVTIHRSFPSALACDSTLSLFGGAAAERLLGGLIAASKDARGGGV